MVLPVHPVDQVELTKYIGTVKWLRNTKENTGDKCIFILDTTNGLQVYLSRKHPEIRNEQLKRKKKNFAWTEPELRVPCSDDHQVKERRRRKSE